MQKYKIIYADPPWRWKAYSKKGLSMSSAQKHYKCLSIKDICKLPIRRIASKDCILFLWITGPMLKYAFRVIRSWGFEYKTIGFVWVKRCKTKDAPFTGMGYWTRSNAELCLLATRGHPKRVNASVHQIVIYTPVEWHSKKPDIVRRRIVELMGDLPRIELFARERTEGWHVFGNQVKKSVRL